MTILNTISFIVEDLREGGPDQIRPVIDGVDLKHLVETFEADRDYDLIRGCFHGYGGLVPEFFNYGPMVKYYFGQADHSPFWTKRDDQFILGCACGEVGCWPLRCRIDFVGDCVTWRHFRNPHRPKRDYSDFGPFRFGLIDYKNAVEHAVSKLTYVRSSPADVCPPPGD